MNTCRNGHPDPQRNSQGKCFVCARARTKRYYDKMRHDPQFMERKRKRDVLRSLGM